MLKNNFLYIPSFQIGALASNAKANNKLGDIDAKFWSKDFPEEFRYPYFLLTAGHSYKDMGTREKMGLEDAFVIGDSGGFQIATGVLDWEDRKKRETIRQQIFEWLEHNSDVAMNIDIPTRLKYEGQFDKCLDMSYENFKYFAQHQSGSTQFLNVLQGTDYDSYSKWYHKVKDFDFNGWGIGGGASSVYKFFCGLTVLVENKEHLNPRNHYFHILGASSVRYFFLLAAVQDAFNEMGITAKAMTDSSSPNIMSKFGTYMINYDLKNLAQRNIHLEKKPEDPKYQDYQLPITCDYDKWLVQNSDLGKMTNFENVQYIGFVQHNLYMFLKMKKEIEYFTYGPKYLLSEVTTSDMIKIMELIKDIIKSDNPKAILEKNKPFIVKFDKATMEMDELKNKDISQSKFFKK